MNVFGWFGMFLYLCNKVFDAFWNQNERVKYTTL